MVQSQRQLRAARGNAFSGDDTFAAAGSNCLLDSLEWMFGQELQHANKMPDARQRTMSRFEVFPQLGKRRRQSPVAIDGGMIEIGGLHAERCQVMQWIEHLLALAIGAFMPGEEHAVAHDLDAIEESFHHHRGERLPPRHAVAILLPSDRLVLVDLADFADRRFEGTPR